MEAAHIKICGSKSCLYCKTSIAGQSFTGPKSHRTCKFQECRWIPRTRTCSLKVSGQIISVNLHFCEFDSCFSAAVFVAILEAGIMGARFSYVCITIAGTFSAVYSVAAVFSCILKNPKIMLLKVFLRIF